MKFLIKLIVLIIIFSSNVNANTVTIKCYIDEDHFYSFLLDNDKKIVTWLDQNNQSMNITIFPNVDKGGKLLIMGGMTTKNEKYTFIIDVVKATMNVATNLGFNKTGKCGNKSIIEPKDPYAE